ncbi:hypothetical protein [Rhodoligotrophos defluvii]|uniref:SRPBCC family protein n=1 Tax=Rhodoligotrophos defluvii TaxID=2561934 RepID=UPI0010C9B9D8|nr:hypothetical protein [Rhodoligotrophos defluvii]
MTQHHEEFPSRHGGQRPHGEPPYRRHGRGFSGTRSAVGVALAVAGGAVALGLIASRRGREHRAGGVSDFSPQPELEKSITIEDVPREELYRRWRDPETVAKVFAPFGDVRPSGDGSTTWAIDAGPGLSAEWEMRLVEERPHEFLRWQPAEGGAAWVSEASVSLHPATGNRGTVVTLRARFDPPGGTLGRGAMRMFDSLVPSALAGKALHYFKSLVQTGEVPTTERQPAARSNTV